MKSGDKAHAQFRYGTWGPAYLLKSKSIDVGLVRLESGQTMDNHFHAHGDETFIVVAGTLTVWLDAQAEHTLAQGAVFQCESNEMHLVANNSSEICEFYFLKTPSVAGDTIAVPWRPGEPVPEVKTLESDSKD